MEIDYLKLIGSIVLCQIPGLIGSFFTASSTDKWYKQLNKPSFNPPDWIFAPVWITLYLLMGISLYLVWTSTSSSVAIKTALIVFFIQLGLNLLWSILFFGLKSPLLGFIGIIVLWIAILLSIIYFYQISKIAGFLLVPYLLWVSFAVILNFCIVILN